MSRNLFSVIVLSAALAAGTIACQRDRALDDGGRAWNLVLEGTAGMPASRAGTILNNARLFTFFPGAPPARLFHGEVLNIERSSARLSASVQEGDWHLVIVAPPAGVALELPGAGLAADKTPMYVYRPAVGASGKSDDAAEIFLAGEPVKITAGQVTSLSTSLDRNVAMVEVLVRQASANFNKASNGHRVELLGVPTTISYAGGLLPDKATPDTLSGGLTARLRLEDNPTGNGYMRSDTARFLVPAHRGSDFRDAFPRDTTTMKMSVRVDLEQTGGGRFVKTVEVPVTAKCNKVLRVELNVNDGVAVTTDVLPWNEVDVYETVGDVFAGWLYVKAGENGYGQSWRDALPNVNAAIQRWNALRVDGVNVHGILVAGDPAKPYREGFTLPARARLFGGWEGVPGTELTASDAMAPYSSAHRDLSRFKAVVELKDDESVSMGADGTVFDGFVVTGTSKVVPLQVYSGAWVNAVELRDMSTDAQHVLSLAGTGTNLLVADNNKGVEVTRSGDLVNATIVNNGGPSSFQGRLINSAYWGNAGEVSDFGWVEYCAFSGTQPPADMDNVPLNDDNTAWFSSTNTVPGPHFNLTSQPKYAVDTKRSPLPGRALPGLFNDVTMPIKMEYKRDIDGKPRHSGVTDIGCYEAEEATAGFSLRWNMDRVYMSSKSISKSEHALVLRENPENVPIEWSLEVMGSYNTSGVFKSEPQMTYATLLEPSSGSGTGVVPGMFYITSTDKTNNESREVARGRLKIKSNLGAYLPDQEIDVYQAPSKISPWTDGYVGSFHRYYEVTARFIHVRNSGDWTIRVVSGINWIKIDGKDLYDDNGYVQEIPGGVLKGNGNIKFRVGMKSTLKRGEAPRYGLITIHKNSGIAFFYVRQGEEADYIYRPEDPRKQGTRTAAVKFSPYSLSDPLTNKNDNGRNLGPRGGAFCKYPSHIGYFFHWNKTVAYLLGTAKGGRNMPQDTPVGPWKESNEVCPPGYRQATMQEWVHSAYWNVDVPTGTNTINPSAESSGNFVYGRYADGFYERLAPSPVTPDVDLLGTFDIRAKKGILMINHYNYASVFFPCAGTMTRAGGDNSVNGVGEATYTINWIAQMRNSGQAHNTHWTSEHLGMSCTNLNKDQSALVRCVAE
jgi:hypothetical protein